MKSVKLQRAYFARACEERDPRGASDLTKGANDAGWAQMAVVAGSALDIFPPNSIMIFVRESDFPHPWTHVMTWQSVLLRAPFASANSFSLPHRHHVFPIIDR